MAAGEIDLAVVRARRDDPSAFVDAIPRDGDGVRRRAGDDTVREGTGTAIEGAGGVSGSDPESAPAVDVLAVVECKRNPDDVARGFHARQTTLGWLAGSNYDPEDWRNKRHPTGHFARGFHPVRLATRVGVTGEDAAAAAKERFGEDGSAFALTRQSFRRFRGSDADGGGFFLRGLWFITRARTMTGMDAKVRATRFRATRDRGPLPPASPRFGFARRRRFFFGSDPVPSPRDVSTRGRRSGALAGGRIWGAVARVLRDPPTMTALFIAPPRSKGGTLATSSRGFKPRAFYFFATHISARARSERPRALRRLHSR